MRMPPHSKCVLGLLNRSSSGPNSTCPAQIWPYACVTDPNCSEPSRGGRASVRFRAVECRFRARYAGEGHGKSMPNSTDVIGSTFTELFSCLSAFDRIRFDTYTLFHDSTKRTGNETSPAINLLGETPGADSALVKEHRAPLSSSMGDPAAFFVSSRDASGSFVGCRFVGRGAEHQQAPAVAHRDERPMTQQPSGAGLVPNVQLDGGSRAAAKIPAVRHGNMVWCERGSHTVNEPAAVGGLLPDQLLRLLSSALTQVAQTAMRFDRALAIAAPARRAYGCHLGSHAACSGGALRSVIGPSNGPFTLFVGWRSSGR
eukprot:scaffold29025_cov62-Phaeocystis_antarctica.AAC.1